MDLPTEKKCSKCDEVKPLDAFYKRKDCRFGRLPECMECKRKFYRDYFKRPDVASIQYERTRNWDKKNPKKRSQFQKNWRTANADHVRARGQRSRNALTNHYIKTLMTKNCVLGFKDIPSELVALKREHLKISRKLKQQTQPK